MHVGPSKKHKPKPCPCGGDHKEGGPYQAKFAALHKIIDASNIAAAANPEDYPSAFAQWVEALREVAPTFGATGYVDLRQKLQSEIEQEERWQSDGYRRKDSKAGEIHGGRRGLAQEAEHRLLTAQEKLTEKKRWYDGNERKKAAPKTKAAPAKKAAPTSAGDKRMSEAKVIEAGARRGIAIVKESLPGAVMALANVKGHDWSTTPRAAGLHRSDDVPENHAGEYYSALDSAAKAEASQIVKSIKKASKGAKSSDQ